VSARNTPTGVLDASIESTPKSWKWTPAVLTKLTEALAPPTSVSCVSDPGSVSAENGPDESGAPGWSEEKNGPTDPDSEWEVI
jgi:hypothetical protein